MLCVFARFPRAKQADSLSAKLCVLLTSNSLKKLKKIWNTRSLENNSEKTHLTLYVSNIKAFALHFYSFDWRFLLKFY